MSLLPLVSWVSIWKMTLGQSPLPFRTSSIVAVMLDITWLKWVPIACHRTLHRWSRASVSFNPLTKDYIFKVDVATLLDFCCRLFGKKVTHLLHSRHIDLFEISDSARFACFLFLICFILFSLLLFS